MHLFSAIKPSPKNNPRAGVRDLLLLIASVSLIFLCAGCIAEQGSRTVVGNHFALPTFSTVNDEVDCKIYESVEGAVITTRKDSLVEIAYCNTYTNSICGVWDKVGAMKLTVKVEPLSEEIASVTPRNDEETSPVIANEVTQSAADPHAGGN